jgi:histidinol-phosphate aminotransferase
MRRAIEMLRPNVVFIASPNNPTGNRMSEARLREIIETAHDALVVVDEAYIDYAGESVRAWRAQYPHLGILRTLSKVGLAALRIGWLEADAALVREIDKARQPFNVSATSQAGAAAALAEGWDEVRVLVDAVVRERARVSDAIAKLPGFAVTPSAANFVWVRTPIPAADAYAKLAARGVLVRSFHAVGGRLANQLRITIGRADENDRLLEGLKSCG